MVEFESHISTDEVNAILNATHVVDNQHITVTCDMLAAVEEFDCNAVPWKLEEIRKEQGQDPVIGKVLEGVHSGQRPSSKNMSPSQRILLNSWNKLHLIDNVLYRKTSTGNQLILPEKYKPVVRKSYSGLPLCLYCSSPSPHMSITVKKLPVDMTPGSSTL